MTRADTKTLYVVVSHRIYQHISPEDDDGHHRIKSVVWDLWFPRLVDEGIERNSLPQGCDRMWPRILRAIRETSPQPTEVFVAAHAQCFCEVYGHDGQFRLADLENHGDFPAVIEKVKEELPGLNRFDIVGFHHGPDSAIDDLCANGQIGELDLNGPREDLEDFRRSVLHPAFDAPRQPR